MQSQICKNRGIEAHTRWAKMSLAGECLAPGSFNHVSLLLSFSMFPIFLHSYLITDKKVEPRCHNSNILETSPAQMLPQKGKLQKKPLYFEGMPSKPLLSPLEK